MLQCHHHHHTLSSHIFPHSTHHHHHNLFLRKPTSLITISVSALPPSRPNEWLAQLPEPTTAPITSPDDFGPVELLPSSPSIFATTDDPTPLQVATSVLLTGAISVFLFRSVRRRVKRAKELRLRSSGAKKTLKDEAVGSLKAFGSAPIESKKSPTPVQALLGGIAAGVIALILYKFTTTVEAAFNRQTVSDNYSVRQITITIRTIVNGLCYLATCVFGVNSVGLLLYSAQLAINSLVRDSTGEETQTAGNLQTDTPNSTSENQTNGELNSSQGDQNSDNRQM